MSEHAAPLVPPAVSPPRVLVVEDEFLIRLTLTEVLADEGYEVLEAETGEQAVDLFDGDPAIAVLLTDMQLPGRLDGRALVDHVRRSRPTLPVIFMTGRPDVAAETPNPHEMHVAKPYLPSEICLAVKRMLEA